MICICSVVAPLAAELDVNYKPFGCDNFAHTKSVFPSGILFALKAYLKEVTHWWLGTLAVSGKASSKCSR